MLSNPPKSIHAAQRQHRRQNSTPSAFEGMTISQLPNADNRRQAMAHRRGLSLDTRRNQMMHYYTAQQDINKVRIDTNITGLANTSQHNILQEAQQQRNQARPGPQQLHYASMASEDGENLLISPHGTPQSQRFSTSCFDDVPVQFPYNGSHWNMMIQKNQDNFANNMAETKNFDLYSHDNALPTATFINFPDSPTGQAWSICDEADSRRTLRRISDGIMERVSKFENIGMEGPPRPTTPSNQNGNNYLPPTPMDTPHDRAIKQEGRMSRFSESYDESMEETIRPARSNQSGQKAHSIFAEMRRRAEALPTSPRTATISEEFHHAQTQHPDFMSMQTVQNEFVEMEERNDELKYYESDASHSASDYSKRASPEMRDNMFFDEAAFGVEPTLQPLLRNESVKASRKSSPHRRTESVASIVSAASIANIVIEETRTDTGVTLEEISQYILSPETTEGKWTCIFENCGKKFGRKENIKSHVQTHLNDRQYQCPTCLKCFVRQHDLKRHAKIHTGVKPYPCECGNSFARHDALTRHRQRGMCIGAFDGVVRKVVKRGRPRKNRPEMDSRFEKSARTRKKNMSISSVSSFSGYSDSSAPNSPEDDYDAVDGMMMDVDMPGNGTHLMPSMSTAPMPVFAPRNAKHPIATSSPVVSMHSYVSPEAIMDSAPSHPATPAKSTASQYNTPPEQSESSSPAPGHFFDMQSGSSVAIDDLDVMSSTAMMVASDLTGTLSMGMSDQDDLLLQFSRDDSLLQLDRDSNMLLMNKFDDEFDETVSMFTNNDGMFFSSR